MFLVDFKLLYFLTDPNSTTINYSSIFREMNNKRQRNSVFKVLCLQVVTTLHLNKQFYTAIKILSTKRNQQHLPSQPHKHNAMKMYTNKVVVKIRYPLCFHNMLSSYFKHTLSGKIYRKLQVIKCLMEEKYLVLISH